MSFTKQQLSPLLIFLFIVSLLPLLITSASTYHHSAGFVGTRGTQFVTKGGQPFYPNGFNAYWLMQHASEAATTTTTMRTEEMDKVSVALKQAKELGLNVVRTWAFTDGAAYTPTLQYSPGSYNEAMFRGLDFVIAEANKYGIYVILSFVNSDTNLGGRKQYVEWARELGGQHHLTSDDDFYTNNIVRRYYKNHIKAVLTRKNTITGIAYKDDPTIFAWELMNEPRCPTDPSGNTLQGWITEMAAYVKSIDSNHLLEVGLEGFYGESLPVRMQFNPNDERVGSDFISNNWVPGIDFATIHAYPDQWIPESDDEAQLSFLKSWMISHIHDAVTILRKPLLIAEFGKSSSSSSSLRRYTTSTSTSTQNTMRLKQRDTLYATVYDVVYSSAKAGGACTGGLFWQLLLGNGLTDELRDGYEMIVSETPSTANIIAQHSRNLQSLKNSFAPLESGSDSPLKAAA